MPLRATYPALARPTRPSIADGALPWDVGFGGAGALVRRLMFCGDSIDLGRLDDVGGFRPAVFTALGSGYADVGPFNNFGFHRAVSGERAFDVYQNGTTQAAFTAQLVAAAPTIIVLGWGTNDMGAGAFTAAQTLAGMGTIIDLCHAACPGAIVMVRSVILRGPTKAAFNREIAKYNNGLPTLCAAHNATVFYVPPAATSDDVHPTAAGYATMAAAIAPAISARVANALPATPTLSTSQVQQANPITITGTGFSSFRLYRDGVDVGAIASPYTPVGGGHDVGPVLSIVGVTAAGAYVPSAGAVYDYSSISAVLEAFEVYDLAAGSISTWTGKKAGLSLTLNTGNAATASQTSFNSKPGLAADAAGTNLRGAAGTLFSSLSKVWSVLGYSDALTNIQRILIELTASVGANNGAFFVAHGNVSGDIAFGARGTSGVGRTTATVSASTPQILSGLHDTSVTNGCSAIRKNGTALSTSNAQTGCGPGNFANSNLNVFGRDGGSSYATGTVGGALMFLDGAVATTSDVADAESYEAYRAGMTW